MTRPDSDADELMLMSDSPPGLKESNPDLYNKVLYRRRETRDYFMGEIMRENELEKLIWEQKKQIEEHIVDRIKEIIRKEDEVKKWVE